MTGLLTFPFLIELAYLAPILPPLPGVKIPIPSVLVIKDPRIEQILTTGLLSELFMRVAVQSVQEGKASVENVCVQKMTTLGFPGYGPTQAFIYLPGARVPDVSAGFFVSLCSSLRF